MEYKFISNTQKIAQETMEEEIRKMSGNESDSFLAIYVGAFALAREKECVAIIKEIDVYTGGKGYSKLQMDRYCEVIFEDK